MAITAIIFNDCQVAFEGTFIVTLSFSFLFYLVWVYDPLYSRIFLNLKQISKIPQHLKKTERSKWVVGFT